jgi:hypothetical protein
LEEGEAPEIRVVLARAMGMAASVLASQGDSAGAFTTRARIVDRFGRDSDPALVEAVEIAWYNNATTLNAEGLDSATEVICRRGMVSQTPFAARA